MSYEPSILPTTIQAGLRSWLAREFRILANFVDRASVVTLQVRAEEPAKITDGMVVYADGTNWNPGSGAGIYARESGAWVKL